MHVKTCTCPHAQLWHTIKSHDINIYGGPDAHFYSLNCGTRQTRIQLHGLSASALGKGQSFLWSYSHVASQDTHCLLWNMHVHYCVPKNPPLQPILINPVHILPPCFFKLHFNIPSFLLQLHLASTLLFSWQNSDHLILLKCATFPDRNFISWNKKIKIKNHLRQECWHDSQLTMWDLCKHPYISCVGHKCNNGNAALNIDSIYCRIG